MRLLSYTLCNVQNVLYTLQVMYTLVELKVTRLNEKIARIKRR